MWHGFGRGHAAGVTFVRRCQKLLPCWTEPTPAIGSMLDSMLAKPESASVLITYPYFSYCWAVFRIQDFSVAHTVLPVSRLGMHKRLGEDTAGTADPSWSKEYSIPYDICSAYRVQGGRRKGEMGYLELWSLSSQVTVRHNEARLS